MDNTLHQIKAEIYDKCAFEMSNYQLEPESKEYGACRFELDGRYIIYRNAKVTPKKIGQFVTFWKRNEDGPIEPFDEHDKIDFYVVNTRTGNLFGQFVFPRSILSKKGIISTDKKDGKRGFRVYPIWGIAENMQAKRTQKWQLEYFYEINDTVDINKVVKLYGAK